MATLEDAEVYLNAVENSIGEIRQKYDSKQAERVLSSPVWMSDFLEGIIKNKINSLKEALSSVRDHHVGDFKSTTQFDAVITMCSDLGKLLSDINTLYKMRSNYVDIRLKIQYSLPQMEEKMKSMRNRFNIIKGQLTKKGYEPEEDEWWG